MNTVQSALYDKFKTSYAFINKGDRAIPWLDMKSYIDFEVFEYKNCPGYDMGWRSYSNEKLKIEFRTGIVNGVEYLDTVLLYNPSMRMSVIKTPMNIFEHLTTEGKRFFINYYDKDYDSFVEEIEDKITQLTEEKELLTHHWKKLKDGCKESSNKRR